MFFLPPHQQGWTRRESTGSAETRQRWRACSGSLNKVASLFELQLFSPPVSFTLVPGTYLPRIRIASGTKRLQSQTRNCSCWVCLGNQQQSSSAAFTQYFLILRKCWQGTPVFRGKHLTFTFPWPIPLSCYSYMSSIASAGHSKVKALFVCMLGSIYNKSGPT